MALLQVLGPSSEGRRVACTGQQMAAVLEFLVDAPELASCSWYAASLKPLAGVIDQFGSSQLKLLDSPKVMADRIRACGQLLDGVLVALRDAKRLTPLSARLTASGPPGKLVKESLVEVRAFDTSWIEICTDEPSLVARLQLRFAPELRRAE